MESDLRTHTLSLDSLNETKKNRKKGQFNTQKKTLKGETIENQFYVEKIINRKETQNFSYIGYIKNQYTVYDVL